MTATEPPAVPATLNVGSVPVTLQLGTGHTIELGAVDLPVSFAFELGRLTGSIDQRDLRLRLAAVLRRAVEELESPDGWDPE
jgi:hypothetical protein